MRITHHVTTVLSVSMLAAQAAHGQFTLTQAIGSAQDRFPSLQVFEAQVDARDNEVKVELADLSSFEVTEIRFNRATGVVREIELEAPDADDSGAIGFIIANLQSITLGFDEAIVIATDSLAGSTANKVELEPRAGVAIYEVNVISDTQQVTIKISAASGEIIETSFHDRDDDNGNSGGGDDGDGDDDDNSGGGDDDGDDDDNSGSGGDDDGDDDDNSGSGGDDDGDDDDNGPGPGSADLIGVGDAVATATAQVAGGTAHDVRLRPRSRGWTYDVKVFSPDPLLFFEVRLDAASGSVQRVSRDENEPDDRAVAAALAGAGVQPIPLDAGIERAREQFPGLRVDRVKYEVEDGGLIVRVEGVADGRDVRVEMDAFDPASASGVTAAGDITLLDAATAARAAFDDRLVLFAGEISADDGETNRAYVTALDPKTGQLKRTEVMRDGSLSADDSWNSTIAIDAVREIAARSAELRLGLIDAIEAVRRERPDAKIREGELKIQAGRLVYELHVLDGSTPLEFVVDGVTGALSVDSGGGVGGCVADFDRDGGADIHDLMGLLSAWFEGSLDADMDDDGTLGVADLLVFLDAYLAGCSA